MKFILKIFIFLNLLLASLNSAEPAEEAAQIEKKFAQVMELYKNGKNQEARQLTQEAYFGHFEFLESGIRINLGLKKAASMERQFGDIRKAIKNEASAQSIQEMIDSLNAEIKEILPHIESGAKLVAEKSDDGGLSAAGMSVAVSSDNPWQPIASEIFSALSEAKSFYDKKDGDGVKTALNKAKFDLYRNTQLEIAIRRYDSQQMDQMIQQILGNLIAENVNLDEAKFDQSIKDINDLISTSIAKLSSDSYALAPVTQSEEENIDFSSVAQNIENKMSAALKLYEKGEFAQAMSDVQDIYFDEYEASGMENVVGAKNIQLKTDTEGSFSKIVSLMQSKASAADIKAAQNKLMEQLQASLELTKKSSNLDLFIYSLIIILREGFEALIIVAAVVAYLIKTGNSARLGIVYSSLGVAVILSVATAFGVKAIFGTQMAGQSREILEGAVMLIAVVLLFYVGFWLLSNAGAKKWNQYIQGKIAGSLSSGDSKTLWWTVFLAVYREGAETVLFYVALLADAKSNSAIGMVASGFIVGILALIVVYYVIKIFSLKIAIKPFFIITSAIIFYMSIVFTGKGVMELVEGKVFVPKIIEGFPTFTWFGIYPYYESLIPQAVMILALISGIFIMKKNSTKFNKGE